jgi:hypothetical protein
LRFDAVAAPWAPDAVLAILARAALTQMRQTWWGWRHLPIVRANQIQVGSVIDYDGQAVAISEVQRRVDGKSVHLTFSEPVTSAAGTIVGWDLADVDPLNLHQF